MLKRICRKWGIVILVGIFLIVTIIFSLLDFNRYTEVAVEKEIHSYLDDVRAQSAFMLKNNMTFLKTRLETEAHSFGAFGKMTEEEIVAELAHFAKAENVERATIVTPNGTVYSSDFGKQVIDPMPYEEAFLRNETFINSLRFFEPTGQQFIDISTPVYIDGVKFGSLSISYDNKNLQEIFKVAILEGDCSLYLLDADGMLIGKISQTEQAAFFKENIFDLYSDEAVSFLEGSSEELRATFANKEKGALKYSSGGKTYCATYAPSGVNEWYIATITTDASVQSRAKGLEQMAGFLAIKIIIVMLLAAALFGVYYFNERRLLRQLKNSYRTALKESNDRFFEVDLEQNTFVDHSANSGISAQMTANKRYSELIRQSARYCLVDERQDFLDRFLPEHLKESAQDNDSYKDFEYRLTTESGVESWYKSTIIPVLENKWGVQKIICIEKDITEEKRNTRELQNTAMLDGLTQLYNKTAAQELIENFLKFEGNGGQHALFMMDIDSFKQINDNYGHAKGDEVIMEVGKILNGIFRKSDIVGRNGGDEFIAFIKDYKDVELVSAKAAQINAGFKKLRIKIEENSQNGGMGDICRITASIGIALYNRDGDSFEELYKNADTALYTAKNSGKDKYTLF